ncbi:hypothetical protein CBS63078_3246 [Aspergillus niger]|nr:hypothetical protein CBS133816_1998 [Aspergillus niger]KAI2917427.1 hypothetical protein CBS63078_3246 [Aspergillus niger]KAI2975252.1 hypothetical protein CBS147323_1122 [Aspergillus niger]KAI2998404.1 hypothetical protein CBS147345_9270 [Aspergillus niger]KAI3034556.1 hypothetical protein CBS147347_92 [Aspergillus niger]
MNAYLAYDQPGQRDPSIDCPSGIPASAHSCHFPPIFIPKPWKLPGWLSATDLWVLEASSCTQEKDGIMRITQ